MPAVQPGSSNDLDEDEDLLSSLIQGLGSLKIQPETKRAPKPVTVVSITATYTGLGSLTLRSEAAITTTTEDCVKPISPKVSSAVDNPKWKPVGSPPDDSLMREPFSAASISLAECRNDEASCPPRTGGDAAEGPDPDHREAVVAPQNGSVPLPKTRVRGAEPSQSGASQTGAPSTLVPSNKENRVSTNGADEKTPYGTASTVPKCRGSSIAAESSAHAPVMFIPRSIRVKTKPATS